MIDTTRLRLRSFQLDDVGQLAAVLGDPRVMEFSDHGTLAQAAIQDWLHKAIQTTADDSLPLILAICPKSEERLLGYVSLTNDPHRVSDYEAELGFRLAFDCWGRGIATEAAQAMVAHATCLSVIQCVVAVVDPNNRQSLRVLHKVGMTYERDIMLEGYNHPDHRLRLELATAPR